MVKEPTEEQSKILQQKGNIVITAKPGSGKTYTIVEKIARVIPDLPEYKGVIAISFTNKASDELKEGVSKGVQIRSNLFLALLTSFIFHKLLFLFQAMLRGILQNMRLLIT